MYRYIKSSVNEEEVTEKFDSKPDEISEHDKEIILDMFRRRNIDVKEVSTYVYDTGEQELWVEIKPTEDAENLGFLEDELRYLDIGMGLNWPMEFAIDEGTKEYNRTYMFNYKD